MNPGDYVARGTGQAAADPQARPDRIAEEKPAVRWPQRPGIRQGQAGVRIARADLRIAGHGDGSLARGSGPVRRRFRYGDVIHNCYSYHFTPGAFMMEGRGRKLGCAVFPGGVGQTEQQVQAMVDLRPDGYVGTPSFLRIIVEKAEEMGADISSLESAGLRRGLLPASPVTGWANVASVCAGAMRRLISATFIGLSAEAEEGLVVEEELLVEIVRPGTGDPVAPGEEIRFEN